jgi:DNA-directed RNA polymerase specialized sigma54-like protein
MLSKESRPELVDPRPAFQNPSLKQVTRVRRDGLVGNDQVDRLPAPGDSLSEHLCRQLCMSSRDPRMLALANWLIWNLDPHGYLREDLSELAAVAGADVDDLEQALVIVQSLDPSGVGARSLQECLLLQLRAQVDPDPVAIRLVEAFCRRFPETLRRVPRTFGSPERIMQALAIFAA